MHKIIFEKKQRYFEKLFKMPVLYITFIFSYVISKNNNFSIFFKTKKFVIVQYGSYAFACHWLTLEQWAWCLLFGVGTLLWGQLVTTIPSKKAIPKNLEIGKEVPIIPGINSEDSTEASIAAKGLWLRGIARIQQNQALNQL